MSSAFLWFAYVHILYSGILYAQTFSPASPGWTHRKLPGNVCRIQIGARAEDVINLEPLVRTDGIPRFVAVFNYENHPWNYSFNPCRDYDIPRDNPHEGYGDRCHSVSICKYTKQYNRLYYYTMGIHADAKFQVALDSANITSVELVYKGIKSMRARNTIIRLVCDKKRVGVEDGLFNITSDPGRGPLYAELHHHCCCPGACWTADLGVNAAPPGSARSNNTGQAGSSDSEAASSSSEGQKKGDSLMFIIIGCLVAVTMVVAFIGGLCYIGRTHQQIYSKLPTAMRPGASGQRIRLMAKTNLYDYEPASMARKKILPVLEDTMIHLESLDMCQRLGGGIFGDTHLAKWKEMTVAVKRLTLLVHENQITPEAMKLMKNEVWFLSRQRHKNIVTILGLCLDGKLPSIITEYVIGECLKDFLKVQGRMLTWPHRVRMCAQVADGMAFLHSTKPPIIHRDLRCGNLFLSDNDVVKVADFGLIKLLQPIREECPEDDCCCRRTMSACPASIRWTAPELLAHPVTKETLAPPAVDRSELEGDMGSRKPGARSGGAGADSVITPACDVFSFAMVMWEVPMCQDPFEEISTEAEVQEILKNGGRPETPPSADMMPQYKELMKNCWVQEPGNRPTFKQVATRLKDLGSQARSYQRQLENRHRLQKLQQDSLPV